MKFSDYESELITRICYEFFYPHWRQMITCPPSFLAICYDFFRRCLHFALHRDCKEPKPNKIVFFSTTLNNDRALKSIWEALPQSDFIVWNKDEIFSESRILFYSFFVFIKFLKLYKGATANDRLVMRQYSYWFTEAYGYHIVVEKYLKKNKDKIQLMIMANDHSPVNQCIIEGCKKHKIKTVYVQHAAVKKNFPRNRFSYSFLDGMDSFRKYSAYNQVEGTVFLAGSPRFDGIPVHSAGKYIGVGTNGIDDMDMVVELCSFLISNLTQPIILRPHPRQELSEVCRCKLNSLGVLISDPKLQDSFAFLKDLKILIANESSVHLDAVLAKVPSIKYNFANKEYVDAYDFVASGIIKWCKNYDEVLRECRTPGEIGNDGVKIWNAAFGTKYEGHVSDLIVDFIKRAACKENLQDWIDSIFEYNCGGFYEYR